jgi:allantoicase
MIPAAFTDAKHFINNEAPAVSIEAVKFLRSSTDSTSDHVIILRMR